MKIGITERGDAGLDFSWEAKLPNVDGAVLITKNITDTFIDKVIENYNKGYKIIVHCTCTGFGKTYLEPNVSKYTDQLVMLCKLIERGFPKSQCVLRIDPIIPDGVGYACRVIEEAFHYGLLPGIRIRISVLDNYPHVRERFKSIGAEPLYSGNFSAGTDDFDKIKRVLSRFPLTYETCAEPKLTDPMFEHIGCISKKDLDILGIPFANATINPQGRHGCLCLGCKTELLTNKHQCQNGCLYCYWK